MNFSYTFQTVETKKELAKLVDFLIFQHNNYPKYEDWVLKARNEILEGYKKAIVAKSDNRVLGNIVYQPHKTMARVLEIKNLRILDIIKGHGFARFLLKQVELDNSIPYDNLGYTCRPNRNNFSIRKMWVQKNCGSTFIR